MKNKENIEVVGTWQRSLTYNYSRPNEYEILFKRTIHPNKPTQFLLLACVGSLIVVAIALALNGSGIPAFAVFALAVLATILKKEHVFAQKLPEIGPIRINGSATTVKRVTQAILPAFKRANNHEFLLDIFLKSEISFYVGQVIYNAMRVDEKRTDEVMNSLKTLFDKEFTNVHELSGMKKTLQELGDALDAEARQKRVLETALAHSGSSASVAPLLEEIRSSSRSIHEYTKELKKEKIPL